MASSLNRCEFIGNLGADPEVKMLESGNTVANFRIACGEKWMGKDGTPHEKTEWIPIVVWGKLAEICGKYLHKGSKVYIAGKFATRKWQDQGGADRYTTEVVVDGFSGVLQMLDGKPQGERAAPASPAPQGAVVGGDPDFSGNIPF